MNFIQIFQALNIYIVLAGVDVMLHRWNQDSETKLSQYFNSWLQYKDEFLVKILPNHDTSFLVMLGRQLITNTF